MNAIVSVALEDATLRRNMLVQQREQLQREAIDLNTRGVEIEKAIISADGEIKALDKMAMEVPE